MKAERNLQGLVRRHWIPGLNEAKRAGGRSVTRARAPRGVVELPHAASGKKVPATASRGGRGEAKSPKYLRTCGKG
jgi:hypothetical protein